MGMCEFFTPMLVRRRSERLAHLVPGKYLTCPVDVVQPIDVGEMS